jgi:hypothetical protein
LGEFWPIGRLFTLGSFLKIAELAHMCGQLFFHEKMCIYFDQKCVCWATFWAIFSQTHPASTFMHAFDPEGKELNL